MHLIAAHADDSRVRLVVLVHLAITGLLLFGLLLELQSGAGGMEHGLLIGAGILIAKYFGGKHEDADEDAQGDHAATRFMFKAINSGDFEGAADVVGEDFRAYANGYPLLSGEVEQGPILIETMFGYWREALPDVHWELYDESVQKQKDKSELLALRFVSIQTIADEQREIEIAAFAKIVDKKVVEWRMVLDLTIFNEFRRAVGLPLVD